MSGSILLPITGSQESLYAIELAFVLAKQTGLPVDAQHVVNVRGALEFVGMERPGIIGSGPYLGAYKSVCDSLREIAEKLSDSFCARADGRGIVGEMFVDEGEPVEEICKRLHNHDLVIMGHRQRSALALPVCQTVRLSLAEVLAHYLSVPLLIVQKPVNKISELAIFSAMDHINLAWIRNCLSSAEAIGASASLTFYSGGEHEEDPLNFVKDLKTSLPESNQLRIRLITRAGDRLYPAQICCHHFRPDSADGSVLAVVPTIDKGQRRITGMGESPSNMLRRLVFDAVLLWPEEFVGQLFGAPESSLATAS